ncbi:SdpI family protein [Domibacillus sp. PGB-M46]|uniref:SdpI family protein n=1 Tax=Domibacillus sp. PGB-M46 TaxID=2910255 RepID=UPI001F58AFA5|nr:SdpI family protein [Domibacillus sp. PGB-M46]MCI2254874.1 SdpI family protein [Domibacillus sp. PGB-M46]
MKNRFFWMIVLLASFASIAAFPYLPDQVATHWGSSGEADGYSSKWFGAFFGPAMILLIGGLFKLLPKIDPRRQNYAKFQSSYSIITNASLTLIFVIHLLLLTNGLGYEVHMDTAVSLLIGALFMIIGNYMPRMRPSYFVGIRTPWTLADDRIWTKTHRTGGWLFVTGGLVLMASALLPAAVKIPTLISVVILIVSIPYLQSYLLFKKSHH